MIANATSTTVQTVLVIAWRGKKIICTRSPCLYTASSTARPEYVPDPHIEKLKYFILYVAARGCVQVVWESKLKPNARTVLNPIDNEGQELLLDFLGAS
jgi:hypothetical protein